MRLKDLPCHVRHTFFYDLTAAMLFGIFGGSLLPFIPVVGRKIGASNFQIALLAATPYLANAFALLWTEDLFGKGRVWYVVWPGVVGRAVLFGMVYVKGPGLYTVIIFLYMLITAIPFPSYASIMKKNYPDELRGRIMAYVRVGNAIFWIGSSAFAGWILQQDTGNFRYLFPAAAVFGVLSALQFGFIKIRNEKRVRESMKGMLRLKSPFKDSRFRKFLLTYTLFELGLLMALPVYPLVLVDEVHISNMATGIYGSIASTMWLAGFFFWGFLLDRSSLRTALSSVFAIASIIPIIYILSRSVYILGAAQGISGFVFAAIELFGYVIITRMASEREVPHYMAANIAAGGARGAVAPFLGASLMTATSASTVFTLSSALMIAAFLLSLSVFSEHAGK